MAESENKNQSNAKRRRRGNRRRNRAPGAEGGGESGPKTAEQSGKEIEASNGRAELEHSSEVSSLLSTTGDEVKQLLEAADDASKKIREAASTERAGEQNGRAGAAARTNADVKQVLQSAEEAAEKIREEAREEARQFMAEARRRAEGVLTEELHRVSDLTEDLVREASAVQQRLDSLRVAFDQAVRRMNAKLGTDESGVWSNTDNGEVAEDEESIRSRLGRRRRTHVAPEPIEGISEGARLLAMQQMMAGVDAGEIEERLRKEFGIEDPGPLLKWMGLEAPNA